MGRGRGLAGRGVVRQAPLPGSTELAGGMFFPDPKVRGLQKGTFFCQAGPGKGERECSWQGSGERNWINKHRRRLSKRRSAAGGRGG